MAARASPNRSPVADALGIAVRLPDLNFGLVSFGFLERGK